jgi:hypothetical protein
MIANTLDRTFTHVIVQAEWVRHRSELPDWVAIYRVCSG